MNTPLLFLLIATASLMAYELVARRRRRNPAAYTLATSYNGYCFSTTAYFDGQHVCTAVHICNATSRRLALASARQRILASA